jgi:hypothetical protein
MRECKNGVILFGVRPLKADAFSSGRRPTTLLLAFALQAKAAATLAHSKENFLNTHLGKQVLNSRHFPFIDSLFVF